MRKKIQRGEWVSVERKLKMTGTEISAQHNKSRMTSP